MTVKTQSMHRHLKGAGSMVSYPNSAGRIYAWKRVLVYLKNEEEVNGML
jgi:hypothetical protein